ncbi:MAG: hypothetical protein RLZZ74_3406 [Cyanobacteriota bacterium]|jgi:hypothetical protein
MIAPGKYYGKIVNYGIRGQKKDNGIRLIIQMDVLDEEAVSHNLYWAGSLNGGAKDITLKAIIGLGFRGTDLSIFADGPKGNAIDISKDYYVGVILEKDQEGKTYPKISWIGENGLSNLLSRAEVIQRIDGMGLEAELMALQPHGISAARPPQKKPESFKPSPEIPF